MCKLVLVYSILLGIASVQVSARCRKARQDEVPHGANEFVQMETQTVPSIRGRVSFPDGDAADDVVVEIFRYQSNDSYQNVGKALKQKRMAACVTRADGEFSFKGLEAGTYLLRAGTNYFHGMNEAHIVLIVKPHTKGNSKNGLELVLSVGT